MALSLFFAPLIPLVAAIPVLTGQDASQQTSQTDVVAIGKDANARMTVPVQVLERGPYRFMVDTGSQNTVISTALARDLGVTATSKARLISITGVEVVETTELEQLDLGRRSYFGLLAPLLERSDIGADGILGLDSLQGQRVLIDFKKGLMAVNDAKELGGNRGFEIVVTARRRSGQLIMTNAVIDGVKVDVVIDTGSETSVGNRALQLAMRKRHSPQGTAELRSVTGQTVIAELGLGRAMQVEGITFQNVLVAYVDSPAFTALDLNAKPALFMGMRDLRGFDRVAIDFESRKVFFDVPRDKVPRHSDQVLRMGI
jgi:predicted aspartyl protease